MCENKTRFDILLERVTRSDNVEGKRGLKRKILKIICDGEVEAKYALLSITANIASTDPRIGILSIDILDSWVMTCGLIRDEIVKVSYMEVLKDILKNIENEKVKFEILRLMQDWAQTLEDPIIMETIEVLTAEGYEFPSESDMFSALGELQEQDSNSCQRCNRKVSSTGLVNCEICRKIICNLCQIIRNDDHGIVTLICDSCEHEVVRNETTNDLTANEGDDQNRATNVFEETDEASLDLAVALSISEEPVQATNIDHESPPESNEEIQRQDGEITSTNSCNRCHIELSSEEKINCEICGKTICKECLICRNDNHGIGNLVCEPCEQVIVRNETRNDLTGNEGNNRNQTDNDGDSLDFAVALSLSEENIPVMRVDHESHQSSSVSNVFSAFEQLQLLDGEITSTNSCNRCHIKLSSSEEKPNCEVCGKTFCTECRISRNDEHGIVNLVCEPCEQVIVGNNKSDLTELNRNESENWNFRALDFEVNDVDDLDLAVALSKSEHERDVPSSTSTEPYFNAPECSVCCERRVNSMLHPCSHLCMCYECACEQWQGSGNGCCPLCRIPIEDVTSTR